MIQHQQNPMKLCYFYTNIFSLRPCSLILVHIFSCLLNQSLRKYFSELFTCSLKSRMSNRSIFVTHHFFLISTCKSCYVFPGDKWKTSGKTEHRQEAFYVKHECFFYSDILYSNTWTKPCKKHGVKIDLCMQVKECHRTVVAGVRGVCVLFTI